MKDLLGDKIATSNRYDEEKYVQIPFAKTLRGSWLDTGLIYKSNPSLIFFEFTAMPQFAATGKNAIIQGKRNKDRGYRKGWFDLTFLWAWVDGVKDYGLIECKFGNNNYSENQQDLADKCEKANVHHGKAYHPQECFNLLQSWGIKFF